MIGHSVAALCKRAARFNKEFSEMIQKSAKLDRLYIPTRYPNGLPEGIPSEAYDAEDSQGALEQAKEILDLVRKNLNA